ncbi:MAG TPA: alpha/beta hydrolase [Anaerolineales bacterium]|nr:alpha/beta hydrolase [Anaerolineales bacterium]
MPTVTSRDGTKIAFEKVGSGPTVILVNGAMSYRRAFDTTLEDLAELLSKDFTVYDYDRRGRGESGNTEPFTKVREIEDIQALIDEAGGEAMLVGFSSGGAVTLETTAVTPGVTKVFVYEVPFIIDDTRQPLDDYEGLTTRLVAEGKLDELLEYFVTVVAGVPAEFVAGIKQDKPVWERMRAIASTIPHDAAFMSEFMKGRPLPAGYWSKIKVPVLVGDGGASPAWIRNAADALAEALPNARRETFEDQTHSVDPRVLAPVIIEFFKK